MSAPSNALSPAFPEGGGADVKGGAMTTIGRGGRGNGRKNGAATTTTTNITLMTWHRQHRQSDNQFDDNNGGKRGRGSDQK